jgi:hypothetical protein
LDNKSYLDEFTSSWIGTSGTCTVYLLLFGFVDVALTTDSAIGIRAWFELTTSS